jgi:RNA polymerase sigma-70 factor, ECF subfamily
MESGVHDDELVDAARAGSQEAAGELFSRHWPSVWRAALAVTGSRDDADDVAQESFEHAFRALVRFNGRSAFRTWLLRIVVNRSLNLVRARKRLAPLTAEPDAAVEEPSPDGEVLAAVVRLPPERRTVIALRYWLDCSPVEIAEALSLPVGTVHSRLARALTDLRLELEVEQRD